MSFKKLIFLILVLASVTNVSHLNAMDQKPDDYDFFLKVAHRGVHRAAYEGHCDIVNQTLKSFPDNAWEFITQPVPADCNDYFKKMNEHGFTALHWAVKGGHVDVVYLLLNWWAEGKRFGDLLIQQDISGRTALHLAVIYGHEAIVRLLLFPIRDRKFILDFCSIKTLSDQTALDLARLKSDAIIFQFLAAAIMTGMGEIFIS